MSSAHDFLDQFVALKDDITAKKIIARALLLAFPDPSQERELTHARAVLAPIHAELAALAEHIKGDLSVERRKQGESFLTVCILVTRTKFLPDIQGSVGRRQCFRALVELIAADPREIKGQRVRLLGAAIRDDLEKRTEPGEATSVAPLPEFESMLELVRWFDNGENRKHPFADSFRGIWESLSKKLRNALFNPLPPSGQEEDEDEDVIDEGRIIPPSAIAGVDPTLKPIKHWIPPEPTTHADRVRGPGTQESVAKISLSTITPLSRFSTASTTVLTDAEIKSEITRLLKAADAAHAAHDPTKESLYLARALIPATATLGKYVTGLTWDSPDRAHDTSFIYPGFLTTDGEWLIRPELLPLNDDQDEYHATDVRAVWIPIPRALSTRLLRLHNSSERGSAVFPALSLQARTLTEDSSERRPSLTALRRTLASRLMRAEPLGITGAQWVAGDDFGLDRAPLYYDRLEADRLATSVARITFPWFDENPASARKVRPAHTLGSRRVPDISRLQAFHASLREIANEGTSLVDRLNRRTRNLVHGLAAFSGHRPNNAFVKLRLGDFGVEDPVATISDKEVSAEWRTRPIVVPKIWREELQQLLSELADAATAFRGSSLARDAESALAGTGPVFLDITNERDVKPFDLAAYQRGVPDDLLAINNYARQMLNSRLIGAVPEVLRVGQMGWHGTREGAWADGSPWSVLSAAAALEKPLTQVLKDVGWRPLTKGAKAAPCLDQPRLAWIERETEHRKAFRSAVAKAQRKTAERHGECAKEKILPRLADYLRDNIPEVQLSMNGHLTFAEQVALGREAAQHDAIAQEASEQEEREEEETGQEASGAIQISAERSKHLIDFLCAGDRRSQEAIVARNLISALIRDARKRKIVSGPIPRRAISHWPDRPGAFYPHQPQALRDFRTVETLVCATNASIPEAARAACALLLHGGYADVDTVLAAMARSSALYALESEPGVLLVEPAQTDDEEGFDTNSRGCLAYHGLAALHLWRWHRENAAMPSEEDLDSQISSLLPPKMRPVKASGTLRQIAALARACNALRMDGWARLVGTNISHPVAVSADRVIALRDGRPMAATPTGNEPTSSSPPAAETGPPRHPRSLLKRLYRDINEAVDRIDLDSRNEIKVRNRLRKNLREWLRDVSILSPEGLLVRYVIALLDRGGMRKQRLEVRTIRNYVEAIGRPLVEALPDHPLSAGPEHWEAAYESVVAATSKAFRRARARALKRFHWTLSQEFDIPQVSFASVYAFCDGARDVADVGIVTNSELEAVLAMLERDIAALDFATADRGVVHHAKARLTAAAIAIATALRPGEVERLQEQLLDTTGADAVVDIRKTAVQRTKSENSRRRARFRGLSAARAATLSSQWQEANRIRHGVLGIGVQPLFHEIHDPGRRLNERILFGRTSQLLRWATGLARARPYWLRKSAIRMRLEQFQRTPPSSLWMFIDLLAEAGHGAPTVSLGWYTHDPVTPFLRWFDTGWDNLSAERLSIASGRSISTVARRRGSRGLTTAGRDIRARTAVMMEALKRAESLVADSRIELPSPIAYDADDAYSFRNLDAALVQVAEGKSAYEAFHAWSWPHERIRILEGALDHLETQFKISIGPSRKNGSGILRVGAPRRLSEQSGTGELPEADAVPVLQEIADRWLSAAQLSAVPNGVPTTMADWSRWCEQLPTLKRMEWDEQDFGRALKLMVPKSKGPNKVGLWPMLRWFLLLAWIDRALRSKRPACATT